VAMFLTKQLSNFTGEYPILYCVQQNKCDGVPVLKQVRQAAKATFLG